MTIHHKRPDFLETEAERRGKLASDDPDAFVFADQFDAVNFFAGRVRASHTKYSNLAKGANVGPTTVSNLASGKTKYPRWSTMFGTALALGLEVTITTRPPMRRGKP